MDNRAGIRDPYAILQVSQTAEPEVIEAAYKKLAQKYHPDRYTASNSTHRMQDINWAYSVLRDPVQRSEYDRQMKNNDIAAAPRPPSSVRSSPSARQPSPTNESPSFMPSDAKTIVITQGWKTYSCGGYGFQNHDGTLIVLEPRIDTPANPQNHYKLRNLATHQWFALKNFRGNMLPIYIYWDRIALQVRVGSRPKGNIRILPVSNYSSEWQFEAQLNGIHKHPDGGFWLIYSNSYPYYGGSIMVKTDAAGETVTYPLESLPHRNWIRLLHPNGGAFPLQIYRDQKRVLGEWLTLDSLIQEDIHLEETLPSLTKNESIKKQGVIAAIGIGALAYWLVNKGKER